MAVLAADECWPEDWSFEGWVFNKKRGNLERKRQERHHCISLSPHSDLWLFTHYYPSGISGNVGLGKENQNLLCAAWLLPGDIPVQFSSHGHSEKQDAQGRLWPSSLPHHSHVTISFDCNEADCRDWTSSLHLWYFFKCGAEISTLSSWRGQFLKSWYDPCRWSGKQDLSITPSFLTALS